VCGVYLGFGLLVVGVMFRYPYFIAGEDLRLTWCGVLVFYCVG